MRGRVWVWVCQRRSRYWRCCFLSSRLSGLHTLTPRSRAPAAFFPSSFPCAPTGRYIRVESHTVSTALGGVVKGWIWVDYYDQVRRSPLKPKLPALRPDLVPAASPKDCSAAVWSPPPSTSTAGGVPLLYARAASAAGWAHRLPDAARRSTFSWRTRTGRLCCSGRPSTASTATPWPLSPAFSCRSRTRCSGPSRRL